MNLVIDAIFLIKQDETSMILLLIVLQSLELLVANYLNQKIWLHTMQLEKCKLRRLGIQEVTANIIKPTYLGISDQGHEGTFTFVSDDSHLPFTFWKSGQPNDPGSSNYDCVEIYDLPEDKNYRTDRWADIECSNTLFSICEQI